MGTPGSRTAAAPVLRGVRAFDIRASEPVRLVWRLEWASKALSNPTPDVRPQPLGPGSARRGRWGSGGRAGGRCHPSWTWALVRPARRGYAVGMKTIGALTAALALALCACGDAQHDATPASDGHLVSTANPSAATLEKLAAADRLDGTEDHVVTRCPLCGLRMAGKAAFRCQIGDYTTHSCTATCNLRVCEDPDGVFADVEIPAK